MSIILNITNGINGLPEATVGDEKVEQLLGRLLKQVQELNKKMDFVVGNLMAIEENTAAALDEDWDPEEDLLDEDDEEDDEEEP